MSNALKRPKNGKPLNDSNNLKYWYQDLYMGSKTFYNFDYFGETLGNPAVKEQYFEDSLSANSSKFKLLMSNFISKYNI